MNDLFQRVQTNDTDYFFEFAAESKFLGTLLGSLPPSAPRCVVAPMDSSLQVRCVDGYTSSTSAAARREGGTAAVITANPSHFFWFRYFQHQPITRADEDVVPNSADGVRTPSAVQPSGGDPPPSNATEEVTSAALPLPSKVVDVKPLRVVAHLAGQLGLHLLVRCGIHGTPIEVRSVTNQDAQQRQQQYNPPKDGTNSGRPSSLFSAPPHLNNYMDSVVPIQFSMHLAAEDLSTPEPMVEGRASASESVTVASGRASEKMLSSTPFSRHSNHPNISVPPTPLATDLTPASVREVPSSDQNNNNHQNQNTTVAGRTSMVSHVSTSQPADWSGRELPPPRSNHVSCTGDSRVPPTLSADSAVQGSSNNPQRLAAGQSLSAMFPLDFAAFAQADYNDVQRQLLEIPLEEEEDEEIRQFLDSCVSMSVAPSEEK
ncbi:hypothetical protein AGDE_14121 [Angomonas deanei]|uniref:Uncharacterized protein n=1 Tax=Angomonas deanei TaxID=59799 RepID=A0A7G2CSH5_9TRYP|nr:hypothetical protein AGDE_14121 [Angomonas deanei]CAD2221934.1 hypothetical protein, conserved [Angomonas deanei]|eukprot:EPY21353.1 hypothetical protein AGDE_14121 [Angomonas deanei]